MHLAVNTAKDKWDAPDRRESLDWTAQSKKKKSGRGAIFCLIWGNCPVRDPQNGSGQERASFFSSVSVNS